MTPRSRAELLAHVEALTGAPLTDPRVVDELLQLLRSTRVVVPASAPRRRADGPRPRLVLCLCGAIHAALAPGLVRRLQRRGFEVRVAATAAALRFVQRAALEALVHAPVVASLWPEDAGMPVPHVNLAQWADAVLVCPASATTIARLAAGDYSELVAAIALTTRAPVVLAPSMNVDMYTQPAVQRNLRRLIADGVHVLHPGTGGEVAHAPDGRAEVLGAAPPHDVVVDVLEAALRRSRRRGIDAPRDAAAWDALFRTHPTEALAWHTETLDDDLADALARECSAGARVLDIGTGLGVAAVAAAGLGCHVVAIDVSSAALARARARADGAPVVWLRDDITDSRLQGEFDVLLDRGCLHLVPVERRDDYAAAVARLTAPGGALLLKTHARSEGDRRATTPYDAAAIERLLGAAFTLEADIESALPGPDEAPAAGSSCCGGARNLS